MKHRCSMCHRVAPIVILFAGWLTNPSLTECRQIAAVHATGITDKHEDDYQQDYIAVLEEFARGKIHQFLSSSSLGLRPEQITNEIDRIDVKIEQEGCLAHPTITTIYQALLSGCPTVPEDNLISAIIVAKFFDADKQIDTSFYPYGLNRLRNESSPSDNVIQYSEKYPSPGSRDLTESLLVLSFLNLYWDSAKEHSKLSETEYIILFNGYGKYSRKLSGLCSAYLNDAPSQQDRCNALAKQAHELSLIARRKRP